MSNPLFDIRILSNNEVEIAKYKGNGGDVVIPEEIDEIFEIEHIYAKNRYDKEKTLSDPKFVEKIGNKSILEKRINIRASDYKFNDKKQYYKGYTNARGQFKEGTMIQELIDFASAKTDYTE